MLEAYERGLMNNQIMPWTSCYIIVLYYGKGSREAPLQKLDVERSAFESSNKGTLSELHLNLAAIFATEVSKDCKPPLYCGHCLSQRISTFSLNSLSSKVGTGTG